MKFGIIILSALVLLLLVGVLPVGGGMDVSAIYYSPVMILLLALLSGACVWCCFKRRAICFVLVHVGVVVILSGALAGYIAGSRGMLQLSLMPPQSVSQLLTQEGEPVDFGFDVAAENFEVKFYPPVYQHYIPLLPEEMQPGQMPFEPGNEFSADGAEHWTIGEVEFDVSNLWKNDEWVERHRLANGSVLFRGSQTPSYFGVTLLIDGKRLPVRINHPAGHKGWRFYLMSYDQRARRFVTLSACRDPGRGAVIAGIWMLMVGTFILCFRKKGGEA